MSSSTNLIKPPSEEYDDDVLYGARREATKLIELIKLGNNSECVLYSIGTFVNKQQWNLKNLIGCDKRTKEMTSKMGITHAFPIQRYCWPQMQQSTFPFICISPESTGKTFAHLLFIVTKCISAIPISKTSELISSSDALSSFRTTDSCPKQGALARSTLRAIDSGYPETFDFDSLGREDPPLDLNETSQVAPEDANKKVESAGDSWGLNVEDHYEVNVDDFITHPKYIIICSCQQQVELMAREIDRLKVAAYGNQVTDIKVQNLPPAVKFVNVHQDEDKLALRCNEAEILIATPGALIKCLNFGYIDFSRSKKVIFDDLDLTLQLHNSNVREIMKRFLVQAECHSEEDVNKGDQKEEQCQVYLFSRKWTDLVKHFVSTVFIQKTLIFGSIIEASLFANLRYELEINDDFKFKIRKLVDLIKLSASQDSCGEKLAIICKSNQGAERISHTLSGLGCNSKLLDEDNAITCYQSKAGNGFHGMARPVYVMSDGALEFILDLLNDVTHTIHFSLPDDLLVLDQRFRLMYRHIKDSKRSMMTTIFLSPKSGTKYAKELYDIISRSNTTLKSTKLQLRDFISDSSKTICWRWASSGVCRLEKLSREDRFGSYCPDRHSLTLPVGDEGTVDSNRWPTKGQVKITITHLVSPNEFYFWFEAYRDKHSLDKCWTKLESTGRDYMQKLQIELNQLKDSPSCSVELSKFRRDTVYGIYLQQEARVDRIRLLELPAREEEVNGTRKNGMLSKLSRIRYQLEYSKQYEVVKIDYGIRISVYLRNIFELPAQLANIEPQCHRGFHLGVRPTDNEPNWLYKAKKHFYDHVCVPNQHELTVWLRLNSNNCFWFENMIVTRRLTNIDDYKLVKIEPHRELCAARLADAIDSEPSCLPQSERLETLSKWRVNECISYAQYAFLRRDKIALDIFVLHVYSNLTLTVRQVDFNKQLIRLEEKLLSDYQEKKLISLSYFDTGVYCIAKILEGHHPSTKEPVYTFNRCKIIKLTNSPVDQATTSAAESRCTVECLDHGDLFDVGLDDLYQATPAYLAQLPFQAVRCKLADLNQEIFNDQKLARQSRELLYDYTREKDDRLKEVKCRFNSDGDIYLYLPIDGQVHMPLVALLEDNNGIKICSNKDADLRKTVVFEKESMSNTIQENFMELLIRDILIDIVEQHFKHRI